MKTANSRMVAACFALGAFALSGFVPTVAQAQAVDPAAMQILKRMTDYIGGLKQFSAHTQVTVEDLLESGQRIDLDVSASVTVKRPNKLRTERRGDLVSQNFYYDGKTLVLYDPTKKVYATEPAPATLPGLLDYAQQTLGLIIPASDMVYPNAFELMTQDVTVAFVVGKSAVDGVKSHHLAFRRPGVDFQVWVADGGPPRPVKLVVTDTSTPALLSVTTVIRDFKAATDMADTQFTFVPPKGIQKIPFMHLVP
jgi:hypothetical protein